MGILFHMIRKFQLLTFKEQRYNNGAMNTTYNDPNEYDNDEPFDGFLTDAEADADALASAGYGTDEDYGYYGDSE
jgi:hypothetical protein